MVLYTVYDHGEMIAKGINSKQVAEMTGINEANVSNYATSGHIKSKRYQVCYAHDEVKPKELPQPKNFTTSVWQDWDDTCAIFKHAEWGRTGKKLHVKKR